MSDIRISSFPSIKAKAIEVMGSEDAADAWLHEPALALDGRRPVEMMESEEEIKDVEDHLSRMDYGVYT